MSSLRSDLIMMKRSVKTGEFEDVGGSLVGFDAFYDALGQTQNAFDETGQRPADDLTAHRDAGWRTSTP